MNKKLTQLSKAMSLVLRHKPDAAGLTLDANGWVSIDDLSNGLTNVMKHEHIIGDIYRVVNENDKSRFTIENGRIRAAQGHSIEVDLEMKAVQPPPVLYHGTAEQNVESILLDGLKKGKRQYVHLSADTETARNVGARHGKPVIFTVGAGSAYLDGFKFYQSENGVWLTDDLPKRYLAL